MNIKNIFIIIALFVLFACKKDSVEPVNEEPNYITYQGSIGHFNNSTIVSSDNNLIICGMNYEYDWSLIKIKKSGEEVWRKDLYNEDLWQNGCALAEAKNGDLFLCGDTHKNMDISGSDVFLLKTDSYGDTLWTKSYGSFDNDHGQNIIVTSDDKLIILGSTGGIDSITIPGDNIYVLKLETNGDTIWTRRFNNEMRQIGFHLLETKNGEYLITGSIEVGENLTKVYLLKLDPNGTKVWESEIGQPAMKVTRSSIELTNGDLLICGATKDKFGWNSLLIKTDNSGSLLWEHEIITNDISDFPIAMKQNLDATYTITGFTTGNTWDMFNILLMKVDQNGNQLWYNKFGGSTVDKGANLIKDSNDDNLITGNLNDEANIFLVRTDKDGNFK